MPENVAVRRAIRQYYVLSFLFAAMGVQVISATYVAFLLKKGLSLFEVNLVNAVFFFTLFIWEIPTGAFADIFGRKKAFVAACGFLAIGLFVYGLSHHFYGFLLAEVFIGVGMTFRNGAFQAWLVDTLAHSGYEGSLTKIFGREAMFNQIGGGAGAIAGAYLAAHNSSFAWFAAGTGMSIVALLAFFSMNEEYFTRNVFSWSKGVHAMKEVAEKSLWYAREHKSVRFILAVTFVQIYAVQAINMYWQPRFLSLGIKEEHLGFLFTSMMILLASGGYLASKVHKEGQERRMIILAMLYVGVLILFAAYVSTLWPALMFFVLHEVGRGFWTPMKDGYLQKRIPSHERATISSFCSIAPHIGGVAGLLVSGGIAEIFGITTSWMVGALILLGGAFLLRKNGSS